MIHPRTNIRSNARGGGRRPVLLGALVAMLVLGLNSGPAAGGGVSIIRRPMPKPPPEMIVSKEKKLDFFFLSQSDRRKDILSIKLVFRMKTRPALERFSDQIWLLRNEVYQFLLRQQPKKNALRYWQGLIQRDLPAQLHQQHPEIDIASVHVDQFERL